MDSLKLHRQIFQQGSRTYYDSSRILPRALRRDVGALYAFVRVADNFVDDVPPHAEEFFAFRERWRKAVAGTPAHDAIIDPFVELGNRVGFDRQWTEDFFAAMELDLTKKTYDSQEEVLRYTWGSAEVIGLFMTRLLGLPEPARETACLLGRSLQYINFLRDVHEDLGLGRRYLPLEGSGLTALTPEAAHADPEAFRRFYRSHTALYSGWQKAAQKGFAYLPWRVRVAVKTASDLYTWTASVIMADPLVVWRRKVKPGKARIAITTLANLLYFPRKVR